MYCKYTSACYVCMYVCYFKIDQWVWWKKAIIICSTMLKNYGWAPVKYPSTEFTRSCYSFVYHTVMSIAYNCINVVSIFTYAVFVYARQLAYIMTSRLWPHNTRLCWALPYKCLSKVCHVHVVLSPLYQEKMVTEQEMEELKPHVRPWKRLVDIQCTKPPDVVKRTAELLSELGHHEQGKQLKGQWVCSVCCFCICCYVLSAMNNWN